MKKLWGRECVVIMMPFTMATKGKDPDEMLADLIIEDKKLIKVDHGSAIYGYGIINYCIHVISKKFNIVY